ncbi:hypothetical protein BIU88_00435 [Chlorobaculum limnaeum]|uniref:O-antigen ligase-related domain-containing protein n=2 Tax=Chlorobaculum limnaeum TaxID=274537 RepID=A0A1D8D5S6_CHLLM|nr:hypothetical protein BIU88_00435 [Chlorobaculum limnaeum]
MLFYIVYIWLLWMIMLSVVLIDYSVEYFLQSLLEVVFCPLIFLYFFVVVKKKSYLFDDAKIMFFLLLICNFIFYYYVYIYRNIGSLFSSPLLNVVYYLLLLLPWMLIIKNKVYRYIGIVIIAAAVVLSMKRTAFIAFTLSLLIYYLFEQIRLRLIISMRLLVQILFLVLALYVIYSYVEQQTWGFFEKRMISSFDDKGSGRLDIYMQVFRLLNKNTFGEWIYGHGHNTLRIYNVMDGYDLLSAHNDWLEILFDYGIVGIIIYLFLHLTLIRYTFILIKRRSVFGPPMAASYTILFIMSLTSHLVLYASYFGYLMAFWGALLAFSSGFEKKALSQPL